MSPARMNTPAAAPTARPLARPLAFSLSSACASAISSRTSSETFSLTSWIDLPRSDVSWSAIRPLVEDPLEDARRQEGAAEREPGPHLGALQQALSRRGALAAEAVLAAGRRGRHGRRIRVRADARGGDVAAGEPAGPRPRGRGLLSVAAHLRGLGLHPLGPLLELVLLARELLLGLLRLLDGLVRLPGLLLGAPRVGRRELRAQLGRTRLRRRRRILGRGLPLGGALGIVGAHSGGSSPKIRRKSIAAILVVTIEASAPIPATSPDHARRLTSSLWFMAAESMRRARRRSSPRCGPSPARRPRRPAGAGRRSSR